MTDSGTNPLRINLLGAPDVLYQGERLTFRSRKVLALLIYLVVSDGWHSNESLMALLWPESDPRRAGNSLRSAIARLRRSLSVAGDFVLTQAGKVAFDNERPVELDLDLVEAAAVDDASSAALAAAVAAVRGDFLTGFTLPDAAGFDEWSTVQRELWHRRLETVYERLARRQLAAGEHARAVDTALQWVANAPLHEAAYRHLMEAYFLTGNRSAALQAFERCSTVLHDELGVEPAADTLALYRRIQKGDPPGPSLAVTPDEAPLVELPLVGRSSEHSRLAALYRQAIQGQMQAIAVTGEAGIGKTRLARAFLVWAGLERTAADVLQGRAFEVGGRLPYQPLVDALRARLEAENAPEDLLTDLWLAELSQLLPELRDRYPDLPLPMRGESDFVRARIFEAVARLLEALVARRPVVLFVDDVHWADEGTLDLLRYLGGRWSETPIPLLLLVTVRQEELGANARLRDWLNHLGRDLPLHQIMLEPLSADAVRHLVKTLAGSTEEGGDVQGVIRSLAAWLVEETGGQPFLLEALLQMLIEQGKLPQRRRAGRTLFDVSAAWQYIQSEGRLPLPPTVRDLILARLERLTAPARTLLLVAAVLGRECRFERLCQVGDVPESTGLTALEELLNGRLLTENRADPRPYTFAHDNVRQAIYDAAGEARRRLIHRHVLAVLERDGAPAAELAYHALAAHLDEAAFRHSLAAGDAALTAHAPAEALAHLDRARDLLPRAKPAGDALRQLYICRGRALELGNHFPQALANYEELARLAAERDDQRLLLTSLTARCILHATQTPLYDPPQAKELGERALALARRLADRPAEARVLWALLLVEIWGGGDPQQALEYGLQSLAICRELDLQEQMGFTLTNMVNVYWALERYPEARAANLEARAVWLELGNRPMLADSYSMTQSGHLAAGEFRQALAASDEGIRISRSIANMWNEATGLIHRGRAYLELGQYGPAAESLQESLALIDALGLSRVYPTMVLTQLYLAAGDLDAADRCADRLRALCADAIFLFRHQGLGICAQVKAAIGQLLAVEAILAEVKSAVDVDQQAVELVAYLLLAEADWRLARGEPDLALATVQPVVDRARRATMLVHLPEALLRQAQARLTLQEPELARKALLEAQTVTAETSQRRVGWRVLGALSALETAAGDAEAARQYRRQAWEIVTYIADHAGSGDLRASFLALPEVQALGEG